MGLADRDYVRNRPQRNHFDAGAFTPRRWSITTWIIALCVGVFLLDAVLAQGFHVALFTKVGGKRVTSDPIVSPQTIPERVHVGGGLFLRPIVDAAQRQAAPPPARNHIDLNAGSVQVGSEVYPIVAFDELRLYPPLAAIGLFSTGKGFIELEVWRLVFFQFLHADFIHLLFNCLGLYYFGPVIEGHLGQRRTFLAFYLACGMAGALLYLILNLAGYLTGIGTPFLVQDIYTPLIGASAGVFGVLAASAVVAPRDRVDLFYIIPMPMWVAALGLLAAELYYLLAGASNAGGHAAHVGGAVAGVLLIRRPHLVAGFFDDFLPRPRARSPRRPDSAPPASDERRLDQLLAKVSSSGRESLTDDELEFLDRMSRAKG